MAKKKPTESKPADDYPAPEHLGPIAKECWQDSVQQLRTLGLLHAADRIALELYCGSYERYRQAEVRIKEEGAVIKSPNGYPQPSPAVIDLHKNLEACRRFQTQYGLTPASRAKINVVKKQGEIPQNWKGLGFGD